MAADDMEDEELRFCFNIDVTEDEFYQNIKPDPVSGFHQKELKKCKVSGMSQLTVSPLSLSLA